jgi:hypothetical protein
MSAALAPNIADAGAPACRAIRSLPPKNRTSRAHAPVASAATPEEASHPTRRVCAPGRRWQWRRRVTASSIVCGAIVPSVCARSTGSRAWIAQLRAQSQQRPRLAAAALMGRQQARARASQRMPRGTPDHAALKMQIVQRHFLRPANPACRAVVLGMTEVLERDLEDLATSLLSTRKLYPGRTKATTGWMRNPSRSDQAGTQRLDASLVNADFSRSHAARAERHRHWLQCRRPEN